MNTDLSHLPEEKREELNIIVSYILSEVPETEFIILYGSYASGKFIDYDQRKEFGVNTLYRSDYDLLVLTPQKPRSKKSIQRRLNNAAKKFYQGEHFSTVTPIEFVHASVEDFNNDLSIGKYFYTEIRTQGIILYDKGNYKIEDVKPLDYKDIIERSQVYFNQRFRKGNLFLYDAKLNRERNEFVQASFYLHQAVESFLTAIVLTSTLYSPKEHNLTRILDNASKFTGKANEVFPNNTKEEERLFDILESAYTGARYDMDFSVSKEDINKLIEKVEMLSKITEEYCTFKVKEYQSNLKD